MPVSESTQDQFHSLLSYQADRHWQQLLDASDQLLACPLPDTARALVWQLKAEAHDALANSDQALEALQHCFALCYWPSTALRLLSGYGLPAYPADWMGESPWLRVAQRMIRQGDGQHLLSWLHAELASFPLNQQRQLWSRFLQGEEALDLEREPELQRRWHWILRALGVDLPQAKGQVLATGPQLQR